MPEITEAKIAATLKDAQPGELVAAARRELIPCRADGTEILDASEDAEVIVAREVVIESKSYRVAGLERRRAALVAELALIDEVLAAGKAVQP